MRICQLFLPRGTHKCVYMTIAHAFLQKVKVLIFFLGYELMRIDTTFAQSLNVSKQISRLKKKNKEALSLLEPSFRYLSPGSEGEKCRPPDHSRHIISCRNLICVITFDSHSKTALITRA